MRTSMVNLSSRKKAYITNLISALLVVIFIHVIFSGSLGIEFSSRKYIVLILTKICIFIILAVSLNLTTGCLGEIVLGHAAFMAVGAYSASIFLKAVELSSLVGFSLSLIVGFIFAGIVGILLGIPALRLKGDYLAIITLGFGVIIKTILEVLKITGGSAGLKQIPENTTLTLSVIVVVFVVTLLFTFMRSRHGRAILAIREDNIAAEASGIPVTRYKVATFALSAALAGIAGAMYAQLYGSIYPKDFDTVVSIEILVIVVLGGLGSFTGSILASIALISLPEMLRVFSEYRLVIYSTALIIIMLKKPGGLLGRYEFSMSNFLIGAKTSRFNGFFKKRFKKLAVIKKIPSKVKEFFSKKGGSNDE